MNTIRLPLLPLVASCLLAIAPAATVARASDGPEKTTIKFSDSSKPGTLRITIAMGDIRIRGAETAEVAVSTEMPAESAHPRSDGLRVLSESSSYSLTEKDNVIILDAGPEFNFGRTDSSFDITVPRTTNVVISSSFGGEVSVGEITGDIEIKSLNGEVVLEDVTGGALVETMNGEISARIQSLREGKPLSFTSMNGEIALVVPADAKANVRLRTQNGAILTDFDDKSLVTKTESIRGKHKTGRVIVNVGSDTRINGDSSAEMRESVRAAIKAGAEAAREAAEAMREAAQAAREAAQEARDQSEAGGPVAPLPPLPPLPPMTGGKLVSGTLNGGGTEIHITAMNGDVTLRKAK
jgi:hypothetical protein